MKKNSAQTSTQDIPRSEESLSNIIDSPERIKAFFELNQAMSLNKKIEDVFDTFIKTIKDIVELRSYGIYILNKIDNEFDLRINSHLSPEVESSIKNMFEEGIIDWIIEEKNPKMIPNMTPSADECKELKNFFLIIPLIVREKTIGVIIGCTNKEVEVLEKEDLNFFFLLSQSAAAILENTVLYENMNKKINELNILTQASREMSTVIGIDNLLSLVLELTNKIVSSEYSFISFIDKESDSLIIKASRGLEENSLEEMNIKIGEGVSGWVAKRGEPMLVADYQNDIRFNKFKDIHPFDVKNVLSVPFLGKKDIIGVLTLYNKIGEPQFNNEDFQILTALAGQLGTSIEVANLYETLSESYKNFIIVLANAIEARDQYTRGHIERVTKFAKSTAEEMGWEEEKIHEIEIGGILHDIGKIGVPDHILNKPGRLTDEEYEIIKTHPVIGSNMLKSMTSFDPAISYILYHHERYDGNGYPFKLKGNDIPLGGRIIAVADSFDAMTSHRPYRKGMNPKEAISELEKNRGSQFDPDIVDAFIRLYKKGQIEKIIQEESEDSKN